MRLNQLQSTKGAKATKKRVGRGIGSGLGKTGGRGYKGQKSRSGVALKGFEGGQMPIDRRLPKRGFNNLFGTSYALANLGRIQQAIDAKKLQTTKKITAKELHAAGVIGSLKNGAKLLAKGEIKAKLDIEVAKASAAAKQAIEKAGGKVTIIFDIEGAAKRKAEKAELRRTKAKKGKKAKITQESESKAKEQDNESNQPEVKAEKAETKPEAKPEASENTESKE